jgi:hypothetical protein
MEGFRKREPLGLLALIFCKILFHDSDLVRRFSNITALVSLLLSMSENYLCDLHILAPAPRYHSPKRFRDCIPGIAASKPRLYLNLDSDGTGKGWLNGTDNVYCTDDPGSLAVLFVNDSPPEFTPNMTSREQRSLQLIMSRQLSNP